MPPLSYALDKMAPSRKERVLQVLPWVFSIVLLLIIRQRHISAYPSIDVAVEPAATTAAKSAWGSATTLPPLPPVPSQLPPPQTRAAAAASTATAARAATVWNEEDAKRAVAAVIERVSKREQLVTAVDARLLGLTLGAQDLNKALRLAKKKMRANKCGNLASGDGPCQPLRQLVRKLSAGVVSEGEALQAAAQLARARRFGPISVIFIGANDFKGEDSNEAFYPSLIADRTANVKAWLVEPAPPVYQKLERHVAKLSVGVAEDVAGRVKPVQAAISSQKRCQAKPSRYQPGDPKGADDGPTIPFTYVSKKFAQDMPGQSHWKKWQLGSTMYTRDVYISGFHIPEKYVITEHVPCLTPDAFLAREGLKAADIDMLGVDTEGADLEIISAWLQVPFFNPIVISYESKNNVWSEKLGVKSSAVLAELRRRGYTIWEASGDTTVALRPA